MNKDERSRIGAIERKLGVIERRLDALESRPPVPEEKSEGRWWRKAFRWAAQNKGAAFVIGILALVVAVLGIFVSPLFDHWIQSRDSAANQAIDARIDSKLAPMIERLNSIDFKLGGIQSSLDTLKPYISDLVQKEMAKASAMQEPEFRTELPTLTHALAAAREQKLTIQPELVTKVSVKLLATESRAPSSSFWKAASALISYRGARAETRSLPDCAKQTPDLTVTEPLPLGKQFTYGEGLKYKNCTIVLDHAEEIVKSHLWEVEHKSMAQDPRSNRHFTLTLDHVHVVYRGGTILPADQIVFQSCTFEFDVNSTPPPQARTLTNALLASGNKTVVTIGPTVQNS